MLPFTFIIEDGLPVSDQLEHAVRKAIFTGQLSDGDIFPSVRTLSQELRISPTTAHKVVATLREDGYLASRPGIGMVVRTPHLPERSERLDYLQPLCRELLREAGDLHLEVEDVVEALHRAAKQAGSGRRPDATGSGQRPDATTHVAEAGNPTQKSNP